jgi:hypothetical protein
VLLECHADACGGEDAECQGTTAVNESGQTKDRYFASFLDTYTNEIVHGFATARTKPVVVDQPARFMEDGVIVGLSSIRYTLDGKQSRAWIAQVPAQFSPADVPLVSSIGPLRIASSIPAVGASNIRSAPS